MRVDQWTPALHKGDAIGDSARLMRDAFRSWGHTAAVYALRPGLPSGHIMTSIEFKLNFLSPARADKGTLVARARVVRQGRRVGVCDVDVEQAGVVVAKGLFTYLFLEGKA